MTTQRERERERERERDRQTDRRDIMCTNGREENGEFEYLTLFNPLKTNVRSLYLKAHSYRAVNTFHRGYKNQSIYAVSGTSRFLFSDKYKTHKYSVDRAYRC